MIEQSEIAERLARCTNWAGADPRRLADTLVAGDYSEARAQELRTWLTDLGLVNSWNATLDRGRAVYIADSILRTSDVRPRRVLDVLSGTGSVANALRSRGVAVVELERLSHYPRVPTSSGRLDYDLHSDSVLEAEFDVALVCTVLHHEPVPDHLIGWLAQVRTPTVVVVENVRCREADRAFHSAIDWFFNSCLNDFGAECPGWYWTREQWQRMLGSLGVVTLHKILREVPGIPFPYDMFVLRTPWQHGS